jgi:hypothetical protein
MEQEPLLWDDLPSTPPLVPSSPSHTPILTESDDYLLLPDPSPPPVQVLRLTFCISSHLGIITTFE